MKIAVIFTGGTIGSRLTDGFISTDSDAKYELIEHYKKNNTVSADFSFFEPYSVLSENLNAEHINTLISLIKGIMPKFDGVIVTHGTDTLIFTASALRLAFGNENKPIILVSSNFPLDDSRANGHDNFAFAVKSVLDGVVGVYMSYKNKGEEVGLFAPDNTLSFAEGDDRMFLLNEEIYSLNKKTYSLDFTLCDNPQILVISAFVGDGFYYCLENVRAVLFKTYHSGTLNTKSEALRTFLEKASTKNIPVFSLNAREKDNYETFKEFDDLNIIPLKSSVFAYTYMKLWVALSQNKDLEKFMTE